MSTLEYIIGLVVIILFLNFVFIPLRKRVIDVSQKGEGKGKGGSKGGVIPFDPTKSYWFKEMETDTIGASQYCLANKSRQLGIDEMIHVYDIGGSYLGQGQSFNAYERGILTNDEGLGVKRLNDRNLTPGVWCHGVPATDADYSIKNTSAYMK
jgi:hypothetical protein